MQNFSSFGIRSWPKGSYNNFVTQLAQAAITNHLIGDASSSYSGASTAGAFDGVFHPNVTSHASTSAYSSNSRRYVCPGLGCSLSLSNSKPYVILGI